MSKDSSIRFCTFRTCISLHHQKKSCLAVLCILVTLFAIPLSSQAFEKGTEAYLYNRPGEAAVFFEQSIKDNPDNYLSYLYLGIAYQQTGRFDRSISTFKSAISKGLGELPVFLFNLGNTYVLSGDTKKAYEAYEQAITSAPGYAKTYVNLGNLEVQQAEYGKAIEHYKLFVATVPDDPLVADVVKMISLLEGELQAAELAAKAAEEKKKAEALMKEEEERMRIAKEAEEERQRIAREDELRKAEEKRKLLMDSVFDSLNDLTTSGETLSAGGESVMESADSMERED